MPLKVALTEWVVCAFKSCIDEAFWACEVENQVLVLGCSAVLVSSLLILSAYIFLFRFFFFFFVAPGKAFFQRKLHFLVLVEG
jgi:hypothetical protein